MSKRRKMHFSQYKINEKQKPSDAIEFYYLCNWHLDCSQNTNNLKIKCQFQAYQLVIVIVHAQINDK